jgi:hypothetical protein
MKDAGHILVGAFVATVLWWVIPSPTNPNSPNADLDRAAESVNHTFRNVNHWSSDAASTQAKLLERIEKIRLDRLEKSSCKCE